ncbi:hypothetical protein PSECIP111951_04063 [Pseudoalteromonas holothuriae]|uniref:Uncharacterized protein n=1 Tax=Pseudoalteromonas holothuriae TaxID=2963714 RepID=A0A9W4R3Y5_9GAMM|nr:MULTISPECIES: hypothetical protein [unclassified Pseudoalteromonas]CAH9067098.1 hypothetical protein PSECIP111854_04023 [Pseudoalteromonas sp. CIP111854]CAH9068195.1 hypothetical protein PSECIP111951_04063 [Pseudoalteromonas sp. CIP111951]
MSSILMNIGWTLIAIKVCLLLILFVFTKDTVKSLFVAKPINDKHVQFEHSLFMYVFASVVFQLVGRFISDEILAAELGVQAKRQIFYIFFCIYEGLFMVAVIQWHNYKRCEFARITTYGFYICAMTVVLNLCRYVDRVVFDTDILRGVYGQVVALTNIFLCVLMAYYPFYRLTLLFTKKSSGNNKVHD